MTQIYKQRCNDSAFWDSRLNSDSDEVFGFNSNSILQDAHCIKTRFTIQFNHQYFISIQFTIQFSSPNFISNQFTIQFLRTVDMVFFDKYHLSAPLPDLVGYTILRIQLEIEPQPQCCQVWLVPTDRMQMCSKRRKYIVKIEL